MKFITTIVILISIASYGITTQAQAPTAEYKTPTVEEVVQHYASQYRVSATQMLTVLRCESSLNPKAIGDGGTSYGIAQIHLPAHPNITIEQAQDIYFSAEFMAKEFAKGNKKIWTCYRIIYE